MGASCTAGRRCRLTSAVYTGFEKPNKKPTEPSSHKERVYVQVSPFSHHLFLIIKYLLISPPALILAHKIIPASLLPISKKYKVSVRIREFQEKRQWAWYCSECRQRRKVVMVRMVGKTCRSQGRVIFGPVYSVVNVAGKGKNGVHVNSQNTPIRMPQSKNSLLLPNADRRTRS